MLIGNAIGAFFISFICYLIFNDTFIYDSALLAAQSRLTLIYSKHCHKSGFTPQYGALEDMYERLKDKGFEVLDFPCNQFMNQAPGSDEEINAFCALKFDTKFPRFKKIDVKGDNADPLYKWLITQNKKNKPVNIKWNFTKFLINKKGEVVERFGPMDKPESFFNRVEEELAK